MALPTCQFFLVCVAVTPSFHRCSLYYACCTGYFFQMKLNGRLLQAGNISICPFVLKVNPNKHYCERGLTEIEWESILKIQKCSNAAPN